MTTLSNFEVKTNPSDVVFTPDAAAKAILDEFNPQGRILDPCKGGGAFYRQLPADSEKYWCEIRDGVDFFKFNEQVDWIISNPPYSTFDDWLAHSFRLADNVVYLIPIGKVFKSMTMLNMIAEYGGIVKMLVMPGKQAGFHIGFPVAAVHFQRGYTGQIYLKV